MKFILFLRTCVYFDILFYRFLVLKCMVVAESFLSVHFPNVFVDGDILPLWPIQSLGNIVLWPSSPFTVYLLCFHKFQW